MATKRKAGTKAKARAKSTAKVESTPESRLVARTRKALARRQGVTERRMFGGHCFMVNGNMAGGVTGEQLLMVRVGADAYEDALSQPHARPMDFTGRPMKGMVFVTSDGVKDDAALKRWLERGVKFARSLPSKEKPVG